jgi:hypothetical protein
MEDGFGGEDEEEVGWLLFVMEHLLLSLSPSLLLLIEDYSALYVEGTRTRSCVRVIWYCL